MVRGGAYGSYKDQRIALSNVANSGRNFEVYTVRFHSPQPAWGVSGGVSRVQAIFCDYMQFDSDKSKRVVLLTAMPQLWMNVNIESISSITSSRAALRVSEGFYERPPRTARTAMLGRHQRDLHVVPDAPPKPEAEQPCAFRVTNVPVDIVYEIVSDLVREGVVRLEDLSHTSEARGTTAHRTLEACERGNLVEIQCTSVASYWSARRILGNEWKKISKLNPRWLPALGTRAVEIILDPFDRAAEEWTTRGYRESSFMERTNQAVFGPPPGTCEMEKWMCVLPESPDGESSFAFCWEQLAQKTIYRARKADVPSFAVHEPLLSYIKQQCTGERPAYTKSEARLTEKQDRQLSDAAYYVFVRHSHACGEALPFSDLCKSVELEGSMVLVVAYAMSGFQPRRMREYKPNGKCAGKTGVPRANFTESSNQSIYQEENMDENVKRRLKRTVDGAFVAHVPTSLKASRSKYPETLPEGIAVYRPSICAGRKRKEKGKTKIKTKTTKPMVPGKETGARS